MGVLTVYDKKTCGTCQKAKAFLDELNVPYVVVDIVSSPPSREMLEELVDENDVKASLNSRSTMYKEKNLGQSLPNKAQAIEWMLEDPNLIKRPVIETEEGELYQGFDAVSLSQFLRTTHRPG